MAKIADSRKPLTCGVVAATLTPMDHNGIADCNLLVSHCRGLLDSGCSNVVLLGTTGEANSFTISERQAILEKVLEGGVAASNLIVGTGCCAAGDTAALCRHALSLGVTRVLMLPPFYYKNVSDDGLFDAYATTIEKVIDDRLRVYLYSIPELTGIEPSVDLIDKLLTAFPHSIAGLKDSSGDWGVTETYCRLLGDKLDVLVGTDAFLKRALKAGASGCVTATANAAAEPIVELFARVDDAASTALEHAVNATRSAFEKFPMIPALKAYLARVTHKNEWRNVRPPLRPLTREATDTLLQRVTMCRS